MATTGQTRPAPSSKITGYFTTKSESKDKVVTEWTENLENTKEDGTRLAKSVFGLNNEQTAGPPRKSLQILQPAARNGGLTRPTPKTKSQKIPGQSGGVKVFTDPEPISKPLAVSSTTVRENKATETDPDISGCRCGQLDSISTSEEEAFRLMGSEPVPEEYWEQIAERRRQALSEAVEENEQLHTSIHELKAENERLSDLAEQAEYFASVLKTLTDEKDEEEVNHDESSSEPETQTLANDEKE